MKTRRFVAALWFAWIGVLLLTGPIGKAASVTGSGTEILSDYPHSNGNVMDYVLMTGPSVTVAPDPGQVVRVKFIDPSDDIVIAEFAGKGSMTVTIDDGGPLAEAVKYNDPGVSYVKGLASIRVTDEDATTNLSIFSLARATVEDPTGAYNVLLPVSATNDPANNGNLLFQGHESTVYDGYADIAQVTIVSDPISGTGSNFGGLRTADAHYSASSGVTGVLATNVHFTGPVYLGNISASGTAVPAIRLGTASIVGIVGGSLLQPNGAAVQVSGFAEGSLQFVGGSDANGTVFPAQADQAQIVGFASLPSFTGQPSNQAVGLGEQASFTVVTSNTDAVQWQRNGTDLSGATNATLTVGNVQPADTGIYGAVATSAFGSAASESAILGLTTSQKVIGAATLVGENILHPAGFTYDQTLLTGTAAAVTADPGQTMRLTYVDLNDDIVQVELTGAGTLSLVLDGASGPAAPLNYNQPGLNYEKGHAGLVIAGADETTKLFVNTVGRATAFDPTG
ncbi:MAG TPA: immunoglobulin domain-containing protein, partial [Opitutus sp.]|nr:immunoglobulin domain-containing protein [Opitutus sp.]